MMCLPHGMGSRGTAATRSRRPLPSRLSDPKTSLPTFGFKPRAASWQISNPFEMNQAATHRRLALDYKNRFPKLRLVAQLTGSLGGMSGWQANSGRWRSEKVAGILAAIAVFTVTYVL